MVLEFLFHNSWLLVEVLSTHLGFCAPVKLSEFKKEKKKSKPMVSGELFSVWGEQRENIKYRVY